MLRRQVQRTVILVNVSVLRTFGSMGKFECYKYFAVLLLL